MTVPLAYAPEVPVQQNREQSFSELLSRFEPITLDWMEKVALLSRTDTKYVLSIQQAHQVLATLQDRYRVLDVEGARLNTYHTLYFDTAGFHLYLRHHAGNTVRFKVRSRHYVESRLSVFEIKRKTDLDRTAKERIKTGCFLTELSPDVGSFVDTHAPLPILALEPKLRNDFTRITLVNKCYQERLTLDLNVCFSRGDNSVSLPGVVIAELKQERFNWDSDFVRAMRLSRVRRTGISKYCIGVSLLYPNVKNNNFKPKLLMLNRIMESTTHAL